MATMPAFLGNVGGSELLLIMLIVLLVFGPKQLPEVAKTLGKSLKGIRKAADELKREVGMDDAIRETRRMGNDLSRTVRTSLEAAMEPPTPTKASQLAETETSALPVPHVQPARLIYPTGDQDPPSEQRSSKPRPGAEPVTAALSDFPPEGGEPT